MKEMNLPAVAICESIYNNVINTSSDRISYTIMEEILEETEGNLFGSWDNETNSYI